MPKGNLLIIGPDNTVVGKAATGKTAKREIDKHSADNKATGVYTIASVREEVNIETVATSAAAETKKAEKKEKENFE